VAAVPDRRDPVRLYQPIWCNGGVNDYYQFQRDCAERYGVIRELASRFSRPFSVLDVGSNYGYFPVRLMEDFPNAVCVLIDNKEVEPVLKENRMLDRSVVIKRKVTAKELEALSRSESFDIVLGLSVLHHFDEPERAYRAIRRLGWWSVFEIPGEDDIGAAFPEKHRRIRGLFGDPDGYFDSHVSECKRPYYVLQNEPFIEEQSIDAADRDAPGYNRYELEVDFDVSRFRKGVETRDFVPGMNLYNFLRLGGGWPTGELIDKEVDQYKDHPDFFPWNFIVGNQITPIDSVKK
jgi:SAM-dependent methyltransferase